MIERKRGRIEIYKDGVLIEEHEDRTAEEIKADEVVEAKRAATKEIEAGPVPLWKAINALAGVYDDQKAAAVIEEYRATVQGVIAKVDEVEGTAALAVKSK